MKLEVSHFHFLLFFLLLLLTPLFAATGFDYPNNHTLRLFNEGGGIPFCIDTQTGVQLDNCGNEWSNLSMGFSHNQSGSWTSFYTSGVPMNYRVDSNNLSYANVSFWTTFPGNVPFQIQYNLSQRNRFILRNVSAKTPNNIGANTWIRFHLLYRDIKINNTVDGNIAYYDGLNYSLNNTNADVDTSTTNRVLQLYETQDWQHIFTYWNANTSTRLDVLPQAGYSNRMVNLTFELGKAVGNRVYSVPSYFYDLELACDIGTQILGLTSSLNTTKANFTSIDQVQITANALKLNNGACTFYLYYKTTAAAKMALVPSTMFTGNGDLPLGFTVGNGSQVTTTLTSTTWTVQLGGRNSSGSSATYTNFTYQVNASGVPSSDGNEQNFKQIAVWDTRPPNATINTTNFTNYTLGVISIFAWANDETNLRTIELYGNETGAWKYLTSQNASSGAINKSFFFNFSRTFTNTQTQCYLYGLRVFDTTFDVVSNKYNITKNVTLCVNKTITSAATTPFPTMVYPMQYEEDENKPKLFYYAALVAIAIAGYVAVKRYV